MLPQEIFQKSRIICMMHSTLLPNMPTNDTLGYGHLKDSFFFSKTPQVESFSFTVGSVMVSQNLL